MTTNMKKDTYLFLSDLDGSLLTDDKIISPRTMDVLNRFVEAGNTFAICTGRDINSARSVYDGLGLHLKGSYVVAYNGGQIYDVDGQCTIHREGIAPEMIRDIFRLAKEYGIHVHTYNDDFILTVQYNECMDFYRRVIKTPVIVADNIDRFVNVSPCKVICIELHDHAKQERFRIAAEREFGDTLALMYSNEYYLELIPKDSGKGSALVKLRDQLGITKEHTIAAGDADNDISMIREAGIGIAMLNAAETVKAAADVITKTDNNHDGLAPILERVLQ